MQSSIPENHRGRGYDFYEKCRYFITFAPVSLKQKGTILEFDHKVSRPLDLQQKLYPQALVDMKINIMCDALYYTDEKHRQMVNELQEVIRKYI